MELVPYRVRSGNTLFGIAQFFQTSVEDILKYNNIQNPSLIYVGQTLQIPAGSAEIDYYVNRPGDSLWTIAQKYNTTVPRLLEIHRLANPNVIYPGQYIKFR